MEVPLGKQLLGIGILNLVIAGIIFVLIKEKIILKNNIEYGDFLTKRILRNVVIIATIIILIGFVIK